MKYRTLKNGRRILLNTEEEAQIQTGIASDPETFEPSDEMFKKMRPVGRPQSTNPKASTTVRLDADILEFFKRDGKGWQTRLNAALKEYVETHR